MKLSNFVTIDIGLPIKLFIITLNVSTFYVKLSTFRSSQYTLEISLPIFLITLSIFMLNVSTFHVKVSTFQFSPTIFKIGLSFLGNVYFHTDLAFM